MLSFLPAPLQMPELSTLLLPVLELPILLRLSLKPLALGLTLPVEPEPESELYLRVRRLSNSFDSEVDRCHRF